MKIENFCGQKKQNLKSKKNREQKILPLRFDFVYLHSFEWNNDACF